MKWNGQAFALHLGEDGLNCKPQTTFEEIEKGEQWGTNFHSAQLYHSLCWRLSRISFQARMARIH